jgi:hypothetical protein
MTRFHEYINQGRKVKTFEKFMRKFSHDKKLFYVKKLNHHQFEKNPKKLPSSPLPFIDGKIID